MARQSGGETALLFYGSSREHSTGDRKSGLRVVFPRVARKAWWRNFKTSTPSDPAESAREEKDRKNCRREGWLIVTVFRLLFGPWDPAVWTYLPSGFMVLQCQSKGVRAALEVVQCKR